MALNTLKTALQLAEGPVFDSRTGKLYFVDIDGFAFYSMKGNTFRKYETESHCTFLFLTTDENWIGAGVGNRLMLFNLDSGIGETLLTVPLAPGLRFNDGKVDENGVIRFGSMMIDSPRRKVGALYRYDGKTLITYDKAFTIPNGIVLERDRFYHIDTSERKVSLYREEGAHLAEEDSFTFREGLHPDGMCKAGEGRMLVALWGEGKVVLLNFAKKAIEAEYSFPRKNTSCPLLVGHTLYVTAAGNESEDGALFSMEVPFDAEEEGYYKL
jgi:Gluconolactonase